MNRERLASRNFGVPFGLRKGIAGGALGGNDADDASKEDKTEAHVEQDLARERKRRILGFEH